MPELPNVCSLTPEALATRREALLPGLARRAEQVERLPDGFRMRFAPAPSLLRAIADVIEAERQCCQFLQFDLVVTPGIGPFSLTVTGPAGTAEMLQSMLT